jgi:hypothetical protein
VRLTVETGNIQVDLDEEGFRPLNRRVIHHSPDGYNWGYGGSGPSDLALSIADHLIPPGLDGCRPEKCWDGWASPTAFRIHHAIKDRFICRVPVAGGRIDGDELLRFVKVQLPAGFEWCNDHWERAAPEDYPDDN